MATTDPAEIQTARERMRSFVAESRDARQKFLAELVRMPSDNPPGDCAGHAERTADLLQGLGLTVERHPIPAETAADNGMVSAINLLVRHRFGDGPVVALNAHGDVVPPGDGWTCDPYGAEIRDGRMYGRGVAVSKSDFATYGWALLALIESGAELAGTVELHFTYDEEVGGRIGPKWLLDKGISVPDYAICAGFSYGVVTTHNGCLHLEATITGRQAHAATPDAGADALEAANAVLSALYRSRSGLKEISSAIDGIGSPSLVVGLIEGGTNTNVVPDRVSICLDRRTIPEEAINEVERSLRSDIAEAIAGQAGIACDVTRLMRAEPLVPMAGADRLADAILANARAVIDPAIEAHGVPLYTDARHYAAAGVPTVLYGAGPHSIGEANAHAADENLLLEDLDRATLVVARTLFDVLTPGD